MTTITAEIDGQTFPVDLTRVSGLDALSYRHAVGAELDALILGWLEAGRVPAFLADLAVVRWLWERQNVDPLASLPAVAASVPLLPTPEPESEPVASARAAVADAERDLAEARRAVAEAQAALGDEDPPDGVLAPAPAPSTPSAPGAMAGVA